MKLSRRSKADVVQFSRLLVRKVQLRAKSREGFSSAREKIVSAVERKLGAFHCSKHAFYDFSTLLVSLAPKRHWREKHFPQSRWLFQEKSYKSCQFHGWKANEVY